MQLASTALNFDTVRILADFPLAYKHSNLNLDIATWCKPAQNLQLKLLSWSETRDFPLPTWFSSAMIFSWETHGTVNIATSRYLIVFLVAFLEDSLGIFFSMFSTFALFKSECFWFLVEIMSQLQSLYIYIYIYVYIGVGSRKK